jgi:hypothetical protein
MAENIDSSPQNENNSSIGCLMRIYWLLGVYFVLIILIFIMVEHKPENFLLFTFYDIAYWACAAAAIAVRFLDVRFFQGQTRDGKPSTMKHAAIYGLLLFAGSAAMWIAARILMFF